MVIDTTVCHVMSCDYVQVPGWRK